MDPSLRKSTVYTGQTDVEYAKSIARKMFEMYDKDRSSALETYEVSPMMQDAYRSMNKSFTPSKFDIDAYAKVMDRNNDGKVTLSDLESLVIRYLCGEGALQTSTYTTTTTTTYKTYEETTKRSMAPGSYMDPSYGHGHHGHSEYRTYEVGGYGGGVEVEKRSAPSYQNDALSRSSVYIQKGKLDQIRRVFEKFDEDKNGFIDERELKLLMEETYRILGVNKTISEEDVRSYLLMADVNKDGKVSYPEYETIVTKALARIGVKFE